MTHTVKDTEDLIQASLKAIRRQIQEACLRCDRNPQEIRLIGASKLQPLAHLISAVHGGLHTFGENYAQELLKKQEMMARECPESSKQVEWHFIGRLQRRKIRQLVGHVDWIHSLDRIEVAQEIDRWAVERGVTQRVLLQVHQGGEASKGGMVPADLPILLKACLDLSHVQVLGLMTLPPYQKDAEKVRPDFSQLRQLRDAINEKAVYKEPLTELSMGMSHDYEVAIEEGATMVRIGTALFGERHVIKK